MGQVVDDHVRRLGWASIDDEVVRYERGQVGAALADQPEGQVHVAERRARRDELTRWDDHAARV